MGYQSLTPLRCCIDQSLGKDEDSLVPSPWWFRWGISKSHGGFVGTDCRTLSTQSLTEHVQSGANAACQEITLQGPCFSSLAIMELTNHISISMSPALLSGQCKIVLWSKNFSGGASSWVLDPLIITFAGDTTEAHPHRVKDQPCPHLLAQSWVITHTSRQQCEFIKSLGKMHVMPAKCQAVF